MKKREVTYNLHDIFLIKLAVFFGTLWLIGIFAEYIYFVEEWKWAFFSLAIIFGVKPFWKYFFGKKNGKKK